MPITVEKGPKVQVPDSSESEDDSMIVKTSTHTSKTDVIEIVEVEESEESFEVDTNFNL